MQDFIHHLKIKNYQKRTVAVIENGSWAPASGRLMREQFEAMPNVTVLDQTVTIRSTVKAAEREQLVKLAEALCSGAR